MQLAGLSLLRAARATRKQMTGLWLGGGGFEVREGAKTSLHAWRPEYRSDYDLNWSERGEKNRRHRGVNAQKRTDLCVFWNDPEHHR